MERRAVLRLTRGDEPAQMLCIGDRSGVAFEEATLDPDDDARIASDDVLPSLEK